MQLTSRQIDVLDGVARGETYKQTAARLGIEASTVRTHIHNAMARLDAIDGTSAVMAFLRTEQRLDAAAGNLHDEHGKLSLDGWRRVVGLVANELLGN